MPIGDLPARPTTRFAPAPTGRLHLGHAANALYTWGLAAAAPGGGEVVLRIEDHDRQRSRRELEAPLLDDLAWLGFEPDRPVLAELRSGEPSTYRQSDVGDAYEEALGRLRSVVRVYACTCARSTFERWEADTGRVWQGGGCPAGCIERDREETRGTALRAAIGDGEETWTDVLLGARSGPVARAGDLVVRDRLGNWTYSFSVVVDDRRHGVDLVVRGEDLVDDTPRQIRVARLLGRATPVAFAHHPLVRRPDGSKLSKSAGDTGIGELRAAGLRAEEVLGAAAAAVGLVPAGSSVRPADAAALVVSGGAAAQDAARSATMSGS